MSKNLVVALLSGFLLVPLAAQAQLNVTPYNGSDGIDLVNTLLAPGGYTLVGTPTYVGVPGQAGHFTGGATVGLTIKQGILLTSGEAAIAKGPNDSESAGRDNGTPGDPQLTALDGGLYETFDANSLTFTFHANADGNLHFNYVFASEEYNEYVNTIFDDVFGFFLDGNNIALVPGGTTPISVNTVNFALNSGYYINNALPTDPVPGPGTLKDLQYDGFTLPFQINVPITAGDHVIKLAVSDSGDHIFDTGVFIEGGTFSPNVIQPGQIDDDVPDATSTGLLVGLALVGLAGVRRRMNG